MNDRDGDPGADDRFPPGIASILYAATESQGFCPKPNRWLCTHIGALSCLGYRTPRYEFGVAGSPRVHPEWASSPGNLRRRKVPQRRGPHERATRDEDARMSEPTSREEVIRKRAMALARCVQFVLTAEGPRHLTEGGPTMLCAVVVACPPRQRGR